VGEVIEIWTAVNSVSWRALVGCWKVILRLLDPKFLLASCTENIINILIIYHIMSILICR
jgi:hypothetical protein